MKKIIKKLLLLLLTLIVTFIGYQYYLYKTSFVNKFYDFTTLNNLYIGNENIDKLINKYIDKINNLEINLFKNKELCDTIYLKDFDFKHNIDMEFDKIIEDRNKTTFINFYKVKNYIIDIKVSDIKEKISENFNNLNCIKYYEESKNAYIDVENYEYIIKDETYGTQINKETMISNIIKQIKEIDFNNIMFSEENTILNINIEDYSIEPEIKKDNETLNKQKEEFNKYVKLNIEYIFGDKKEHVSKETIYSWLSLNEDNTININYENVLGFIKILSDNYNTKGKKRIFNSTERGEIEITKGDYGYSISQTKETEKLIEEILKGEDISREPLYLYKGYNRMDNDDIGNTYVEIDLTKQHLWMYKDGIQIVSSDIVTGNVSKGHTTPAGIYGLTYKQRDAVLRGPGYASPVTYWMPFNGGIGLHDATWRNKFGGTIYKTNGSHGCINMPKENAKIVFENIENNMPIILYN